MQLNQEELMNISGGAIKAGVAIVVGGLVALLVGIVDGYLRPLKCR